MLDIVAQGDGSFKKCYRRPSKRRNPGMAMKTVVALPGEGIGIEVVDATCELLMGTGLPLKILTPPQGAPLPEETKQAAREAGGALFGGRRPARRPAAT